MLVSVLAEFSAVILTFVKDFLLTTLNFGDDNCWLERASDKFTSILHGAVTTGEDWRFGVFERAIKRVVQDITLYRVPEGIEALLRTLIGVLKAESL